MTANYRLVNMQPRPILWGLALFCAGFIGINLPPLNLGFPAGMAIAIGSAVLELFSLPIAALAEVIRWSQRRSLRSAFESAVVTEPIRTQSGEIVRSKEEKAVADYLYHSDIKYSYEEPQANRNILDMRTSRPPFYLPDYELYVEYWGITSTAKSKVRSQYESARRWKTAQYQKNGIKFISLYPSDLGNLDQAFMYKLRELLNSAR